jgi:hypothetical protein
MADLFYSKQVADWIPDGEFQSLVDTPHHIEKVKLESVLKYIHEV